MTNLGHAVGKILLLSSVLDNRDHKTIEIMMVLLGHALADTLDHLLVSNHKFLAWVEERGHDGVLGVGVDTGTGRAHRVGIVEQGRAGRRLQDQGFPEHDSAGQFENEEVLGLHSLLLDTYIFFFDDDGGEGGGVGYFLVNESVSCVPLR